MIKNNFFYQHFFQQPSICSYDSQYQLQLFFVFFQYSKTLKICFYIINYNILNQQSNLHILNENINNKFFAFTKFVAFILRDDDADNNLIVKETKKKF